MRTLELGATLGISRKRTENYSELTFPLTHATPLLSAPTLSEGECRVSAGERR